MFKEWLGKYRATKADEKQRRLAVRSEVLSLIVSMVTGRSQMHAAEAEAMLNEATSSGIVSDSQADEIHEVARAAFGYLHAGEVKPIDLESILASHSEMRERHRTELAASGRRINEAESHNAAIQDARQNFQALAIEQPEVCSELIQQTQLTWKPRIHKQLEKPTRPGSVVVEGQG